MSRIHLTSTTQLPSQFPSIDDLFDSLPYGVIAYAAVRDPDGHIVDYRTIYSNQQALRVTGQTHEQLTSQFLFQRSTYALNEAEQFRRVVEERAFYDGQWLAPDLDRWFAFENRPLGDGFFTTFRDVDALKRTEQKLEEQNLISQKNAERAQLDAQAFQRQNELLEGVLRTSDNAVLAYEALRDEEGNLVDFRVTLANEASLLASNRQRQDVIGSTLTSLYPGTKQFGLWDQYVAVYETGNTFRGTHHYPDVNKWFSVTINKLGDGLVATFNDITLSKLAARQIEEQARLFDSVLGGIANGLSVLEAVRDGAGAIVDLRYLRASQTVLHDTGLTEAELLGKTMLSLFPSVRNTAYWPAYLAAFATGEPQRFEEHYTFDGFANYTDNWVTRIDSERIISIYSIINDRKQAELQVKQQASMLQSVLDSCQIPIVLFQAIRNDKGQIIDFNYLLQNEANARTVHYPVAETTTRTMLDVLPNLKASGIFDRYVAVVETGQPQQFEQHYTDHGVDGWFNLSVVRQGDGIVVAANDQTLLRQTLQRAEQLVSELKHSNASLEQFAYVASHDLQEPLRKIQSFGNLLFERYSASLSDEGQDLLHRMQSASARMSVLIRDLLAYSRLSTQQEPVQSVDLQTVVADIEGDLELIIGEKHAQLTVQPLPTINGHPVQLRQLFQNLLSNALKFSRPHTHPAITVSWQRISPDDVPVSIPDRAGKTWIAFRVTDNGIGFDDQYQERIFQLFERLHGRSDYAGTGIGLAVCRKVAENHGGTITAHSRPGEGATFTVYLPG